MNADTIRDLQRSLKEGEKATWLTSQGVKLFKINLTGIVDDEKRVPRYLKVRK